MAYCADPTSNRMLAALTDADWQHWQHCLEPVEMKSGQVLYEPNRQPAYAHFPTSAIVALSYVLVDGASAQLALIGDEGVVGTALFMDGGTTTSQGVVLIAGQGFRIRAQVIRAEFERSDAVRHLFLRYTQALMTQMAQTAVCNRHHTIDQQVCGWLLHCLDRLPGREVLVTQAVLGSMLGVRRESVTEVAGRLQRAGLIHCARGHMEVLDRGALERRACECHAVVLREYARLLPHDSAARPAAQRLWPRSASDPATMATV